MKPLALALLTAALLGQPASALTITRTCTGTTCTLQVFQLDAGPRIIRRGQPEEGAAERERKWLEFCKPTFRTDELGVEHYVYAEKGCQYGRSQ